MKCRAGNEDSSPDLDRWDIAATDSVVRKRAADPKDGGGLFDGQRQSLVSSGGSSNAGSAGGASGLGIVVGCTDAKRLGQLGGTR
jgi:hypothetical protein